jgi:benzoyl-CoA reductase/2-hydroxyglutaryl-CoA dehydratase subunit BcrC/BadD/HgdB
LVSIQLSNDDNERERLSQPSNLISALPILIDAIRTYYSLSTGAVFTILNTCFSDSGYRCSQGNQSTDMKPDSSICKLQECYRQRDQASSAWKATGRKVVGYLCDNIPEELIIAAGFMPLRLTGDPSSPPESIEQYILPYSTTQSPRIASVDSILHRILTGHYRHVDYLVIPHNRQAVQLLYKELLTAQHHHPELSVPELFFLDRTYAQHFEESVFNRDCLLEFRTQVEKWCGRQITDELLRDAIEICNENKKLLLEISRLRTMDPPRISGVLALELIGSSMFMHKQDHNELLRQAIEDQDFDTPGEDSLRVFVGGSPIDHLRLYEIIESNNAIVVNEDHCWGNRAAELPVNGSSDPLLALAERYHQKPACSIGISTGSTIRASVKRAIDSRAQAAIFYCVAGDRSQVWETPDETKLLGEHGVPSLHLKEQDYSTSSPELEHRIAAFLDDLASRP